VGILYIARHGESVWNAKRRIQGQRDVALSERGVRQAEALARRLTGERLDVVFASDLQRARNTAAAVAALQPLLREPVRVRAELRERSFGSWEGHTAEEARVFRERLGVTTDGTESGAGQVTTTPDWWEGPPDGETFLEMTDRMLGAWAEVAEVLESGATVLIVGHAASLRALLCGLSDTPPAEQRRWQMNNAALSRVRWVPGSLSVESWNDATHTIEAEPSGEQHGNHSR